MIIKKLGKSFLASRLEKQVQKLRDKNDFKIVAVAGSVGKTTTKLAVAKILEPSLRVQYQTGNYNDRLTVPLVFFGESEPAIFDIASWLKLLKRNKQKLQQNYPFDVVVLELGSDGPGQIKDFAYLKPDVAIVTALTDEHMEYFKTLDAVAAEELTVAKFARQTLINTDDSPAKYVEGATFKGYGFEPTDFTCTTTVAESVSGQTVHVPFDGQTVSLTTSLMGKQGAKSVMAAAIAGHLCGLSHEQLTANAVNITAFSGRMQYLQGIQGSTIIDDTYNASPIAVKAALDTLYEMNVPQRIALLGNMNEMGDLSDNMHTDVGGYCDPTKLDLVITLGPDANNYLATAAEGRGCTVARFDSPYEAGAYMKDKLQPNAAVLVKGSQNRVFSEEAIKSILANPADVSKLVRQSDAWMKVKKAQFNG